MLANADNRTRWIALAILCMGALMIVLDVSIVNVALPSIKTDLGFSDSSIAWIVNAYTITFGGFLLLGGKLGDLFGERRFFLIGIALFTFMSLACAVANSQWMLIAARALQGVGGAVADAVALALVLNLFQEGSERAKAMGFFGFVAAGGGSIGVILGGLLTGAFNWHWIFLINLPIGIATFILALLVIPHDPPRAARTKLDIFGALIVTSAIMLAVYAIVGGNDVGWTSPETLLTLGGAIALFAAFLLIEAYIKVPLVPLSIFRNRNLSIASSAGVLWSAGMFAWFFLSALYMQVVLQYDPLAVGLAFLPGNLVMAVLSIWLSAKIVGRFGVRNSLVAGLSCVTLGLLYLARVPVDGNYWIDIFPSMALLGLGAGISFNPMILAAMHDVKPEDSGLASGVANTAFMMGGALGLAILASTAAYVTTSLLAGGADQAAALTSGYHVAFFISAIFAALGTLLAATLRVKIAPDSAPVAAH
ncbi:DHA2 family efflux MFS transporter permease subunit [Candidatus Parcubacteria bacterium]|nr:MAG: DHA2 family efflux MFS transporter permease subunit [Candidatus Parcubacteria bacterium]